MASNPARRHKAIAAFALSLATFAAPNVALATHAYYRYYAGQQASSGTNGIDGYIRGSGSIMLDPSDHAVAEWIGLVNGAGSSFHWVQSGQYQGLLGFSSSPNAIHLYYESLSCTGSVYQWDDLGAPPTPNYPVYMNWAGGFSDQDCSSYYFPFRVGSWTSAPVGTGRMQSSAGLPQAYVENRVRHGSPVEPIGNIRFGQDHAGNVSSGYGLHVYTRAWNQWSLWTANFPNGTTTTPSRVPPGYQTR